jgi:hypothetical protein
MDKEIEEFRDEVVQWRGSRRQGAHPYPAAMKAKALQLTPGTACIHDRAGDCLY